MTIATSNPTHVYLFHNKPMSAIQSTDYLSPSVTASKGDGTGTKLANTPEEVAVYWVNGRITILDPRGFSVMFNAKETALAREHLATPNSFKSRMVWMVVNKKLTLVPHDTVVQKPTAAPKIPTTTIESMVPGTVYTTPSDETIKSSVFLGRMYIIPLWMVIEKNPTTMGVNQMNFAIDYYVDGSESCSTPYHEGVIVGSTDPAPMLVDIKNRINGNHAFCSPTNRIPKASFFMAITTKDEINSALSNRQYLIKVVDNTGDTTWINNHVIIDGGRGDKWAVAHHHYVADHDTLQAIGVVSVEVYTVS